MKWLYRLGSLCAVCAITLSFLIVPASATDTAASDMSYDWNRGGVHITGVFSLPRYDTTYVNKKVSGSVTAGNAYYASMDSFSLDEELMFSGPVAIYVSYYFNTDVTTDGEWILQSGATYGGYYTNDIGASGSSVADIDYFDPVRGTNHSRGFRLTAHFLGTPQLPISAIGICRTNGLAQTYFKPNVDVSSSVGSSRYWYLNVPSATVVGTATSEELSALENMADSIAAQNEILNAMYGDIVSICNSIYQRTGDLVAAQNLTNQYFAQITPILNAIQTNTNTTAVNTSNIYSLLASQFALIISTIQSESFDIQEVLKGESQAIQDALDAAADKIILYLDTAFAGAVGDIPESVNGADESIQQEHEFTEGMFDIIDEGIDSVVPSQFEPPPGQSNAFSLIGTFMTALFENLGDFGFIWVFGWIAGLCAFILGRLRRFKG